MLGVEGDVDLVGEGTTERDGTRRVGAEREDASHGSDVSEP